jgi:tetratricopeptide (TPR) repeat protein
MSGAVESTTGRNVRLTAMSNGPQASNAPPVFGMRTARKWLVRAIVLVVVVTLAGWFARGMRSGGSDDPERLWSQARQAWSTGQLDEAESALTRLAKLRPATVTERLLRAGVARKRGRLDAALHALEGVSDTTPDACRIWSERGLIEFDRNRGRAAEAAFLRAIALDPKFPEPRHGLIDLYTIEGRRSELGAQFRALARTEALEFDDLYLWTLGRRPDIGPANLAAKLEQVVANDPSDRWARLALAENLRRLGRLDEAETTLSSLSADPDAIAELARVALDRGSVDDALKALAAASAEDPAIAQLRGLIALSLGDKAALDHYRRALAAKPTDRDCLFGYGQALRLAGRGEEATTYLDAARARDHLEWMLQNARALERRDDQKALRAIGDGCRSLGRKDEARAWYRLALAPNPLATDIQKSLFELDSEIASDRAQSTE